MFDFVIVKEVTEFEHSSANICNGNLRIDARKYSALWRAFCNSFSIPPKLIILFNLLFKPTAGVKGVCPRLPSARYFFKSK